MPEQSTEAGEQLDLITEETVEAVQEQEQIDAQKEAPQKEVEAVQEEVATEDVEAEEAPPPEEDSKAEEANERLSSQLKNERKETTRLQSIIKGMLDGLTKDLSSEDKSLIAELGGDKSDKQLEIYNRLKAAGKIGTAAAATKPEVVPEADRTRVAAGDGAKAKPKGWKEADRRMSRRLKQVR